MGERSAPAVTTRERRALEALDPTGLVDAVRALVAIPTWNGNETPAQELVSGWMADGGLSVDRWEIDLDELARHPAYSAEIERDSALGVVGTLGGEGDGPTLILNGHVDVVPPGDPALWSRPPLSGAVEGGRIHGRGALDMKGALCAALFALRALRDSGTRLRGTVHLESVVGEEDGGTGTLATILRGYRGDGAVVMEPTGLAVAPANAGALNFRVRVRGRAAHGAVREEGVSALEKLIPVLNALRGLEEERNAALTGDPLFAAHRLPFPICVGTVRGGDWASSVPDHVTVEGRFGVAPGEDLGDAREALEEAVAAAGGEDEWLRDHPPRVEWWGGRFEPARTATDERLVTTLRGSARDVTGSEPSLEGMTYGADTGLLVNHGETPTVLFGPGDIRDTHRPDESVAVDELVALARTVAVTAMRFCGVVDDATSPQEEDRPHSRR